MSKCDHDLAVRQDPQSGAHELLFCTKGCGLEPKRRVSAAESIRQSTESSVRLAHDLIEALRAEIEELRDEHKTLSIATGINNAAVEQRLKNLEASQLPIAVGA